jgi:hypothetical protein
MIAGGVEQQPGRRLAAAARPGQLGDDALRVMKAVAPIVELDPLLGQQRDDALMHVAQVVECRLALGSRWLVGDRDEEKTLLA